MKTIISMEQAIKDGNSSENQHIKGEFVGKHVYCNVNSLVEYIIGRGYEDRDAPFSIDDVENYYSFPEWSETVLGEDLYFEGGYEDDKDKFLEEFERLQEESEQLLTDGTISEQTHEDNLEQIEKFREEFKDIDDEPSEIFEWWAVSEFLYRKLKENGYCVLDAGSCYVWGRTTTGQAILLDHVITDICADMGILEGQENSWARKS